MEKYTVSSTGKFSILEPHSSKLQTLLLIVLNIMKIGWSISAAIHHGDHSLPGFFQELPWEYAKNLVELNKIGTVADSLLNLPWLFVQSNHETHTLRGEDLPQNDPIEREKHLMYFNKREKELHKESNGFENIEYFLDVEINHPVSDKSMYRMTFSSSFKAAKLNNFQASLIEFTDLLKVGELYKNFINQKEIMIPDHAFVLHLKLTIPSMNKRKLYSCLVCSTKDFLEKDFSKSSTREYSVGLEIDQTSFITLKFRTFEVDFSTETGAAAITRMFPADPSVVLKNLPMFRFILYETVCDCQFESSEVKRIDPRRPQNGHKQTAEYLGQQDYYTIYNTQNNYFFQQQPPTNRQTYYQDPMRTFFMLMFA